MKFGGLRLRRRFDDLPILYELADAEDDAGALAEADKELESMQAAIDELEVRTLLSGSMTPARH